MDKPRRLVAEKARTRGSSLFVDVARACRPPGRRPAAAGPGPDQPRHNAIKFTEKGEIVVSAWSAGDRRRGASCCSFAVQDTGIGMTPEQIGQLFQSFSARPTPRPPASTAAPGSASSISKQLVEMMGGEIGSTSEPGEGQHLPLHRPARHRASRACAQARAGRRPARPAGARRRRQPARARDPRPDAAQHDRSTWTRRSSGAEALGSWSRRQTPPATLRRWSS